MMPFVKLSIFANTQSPILQDLEEHWQRILNADYSKMDIDALVDALSIALKSKEQLKMTLKQFPILSGGQLGLLNIKPVTIELQKDDKPYHARYCSISKSMEESLTKQIHRMYQQKLSYDDESPWVTPIFAQPKKTGEIRILTDFRKMNQANDRKPSPLPRIGEIIQRLEHFLSAKALDLS